MRYFPDKKIEESLFEKFNKLSNDAKVAVGCLTAGAATLACIGALALSGAFTSIKQQSSTSTPTERSAATEQAEATSISTSVPAVELFPKPEEIPFENPYVTMRLLPSSSFEGNLRIRMLGAGSPIYGQELDIHKAVKDITGVWTALYDFISDDEVSGELVGVGSYLTGETDGNGEITIGIPVGDYLIKQASKEYKAFMSDGWGVPIREGNNLSEGIPFTLVPERDLEIILNLAVLDVGVLDEKGSAISEMEIYLYCQTKDIAGNYIVDENRCPTFWSYGSTDNRGIARFLLGLGPYMICSSWGSCVNNVNLKPGEYREMRIVRGGEYEIKDWWWVP